MKKLGGVAAIVIAVFLFLGLGWWWFQARQTRVLAGFARPTFPYGDYTIEELGKMYPQYIENNAPTVQSPEETHQKFLAALKKGDFDEAVECCFREGDRGGMKKRLLGIKDNGDLPVMVGDLGVITEEFVTSWKATYSYLATYKGNKIGNTINFIKSQDGIWYIESL